MGLIYCITNKLNNKKYIGQTTKTADLRFAEHVKIAFGNNSKKKQAIHLAIYKYGKDNFEIQVIEDNINNKDILNKKEEYYISKYNTMVPNGYNIHKGGQGGNKKTIYKIHPTDNVILDIYESESQAAIKNEGLERTGIGRAASHKTRGYGGFRWSNESNINEWQPPLQDIDTTVLQIDNDYNIVNEYKSATQASLITHINEGNIYSSAKSCGKKRAGGFYWCYKNQYNNFTPMRKCKRIIQKDTSTNQIIKIWDSAKDAACYIKDLLKLDGKIRSIASTIRSACLDKTINYNYYWEYASE